MPGTAAAVAVWRDATVTHEAPGARRERRARRRVSVSEWHSRVTVAVVAPGPRFLCRRRRGARNVGRSAPLLSGVAPTQHLPNISPRRARALLVVGALALPVAACGDSGSESTDSASTSETGESGETNDGSTSAGGGEGETVYSTPVEGGNSFTCETCHALTEPAPDGLRRPGHPIGDATRRPSYKNGKLQDMLPAVNSCLEEWMLADPWAEDDPRWQALYSWLDGMAPEGDAPPLSFEIVQPPADLTGGDPDNGRAVFNSSCAVCHAADGVGTNQAPPVAGFGLSEDYTGQRVRTSGLTDSPIYDGLTGGRMPFWAADRLSDAELIDIAAWLAIDDGPDATTGTTDPTTTTTTTGGDCTTDHPYVGWTAELQNIFHDVGGTAEIVDDCTIVINNFTYDGTGIDVRIYGGIDGDYDNGFPMTEDLLKPGGYNGTTLVATVPDGQTLDDLNGISVWCVDVGVDFGSGMFGPP